MKAALIQDYSAPVEIAEIAKPDLKDDSVLIEVHAASVNTAKNEMRRTLP